MKIIRQVEVKNKVLDKDNNIQDGEEVLMKGEIHFNTYAYQDRLAKYQEVMSGVNLGEDSTSADDLMLAGRYFSLLKEKAEKVDIQVTDGDPITSVEELYEYAEGISVGNSLALEIISSQRLGKKTLN